MRIDLSDGLCHEYGLWWLGFTMIVEYDSFDREQEDGYKGKITRPYQNLEIQENKGTTWEREVASGERGQVCRSVQQTRA